MTPTNHLTQPLDTGPQVSRVGLPPSAHRIKLSTHGGGGGGGTIAIAASATVKVGSSWRRGHTGDVRGPTSRQQGPPPREQGAARPSETWSRG